MNKIKVIGHMTPDTDTTCSAISYAWFLTNQKKKDAEAFVFGEINNETKFVLNKFKVDIPKILKEFSSDDEVVLVDTNNLDELPKSIKNAKVIEIIDHHKLCSGLTTNSPIPITTRPVASTSTIIWKKIKEEGITNIPNEIIGIMLAAILSDSLKLTSPTTTEEDREAVMELSKISGEDFDKLSGEMFEAKSDLTGMGAEDILLMDSKVFETKGKKVRYSVLETTSPKKALFLKDELVEKMKDIKIMEKLDYLFFFVVDILKSEATLIVSTEEEKKIAEKAFSKEYKEDMLKLPGVVSRKKQIIPSIEKQLS